MCGERRVIREMSVMVEPSASFSMRLREGMRGLAAGAPVIAAQMDAGFDSASGFRDAFARLFGHPPAAMRGGEPGLFAEWIDTQRRRTDVPGVQVAVRWGDELLISHASG